MIKDLEKTIDRIKFELMLTQVFLFVVLILVALK